MDIFPTLYKKATTGKMLSWSISVTDATINETWGQIGGKQQSTSDTIKEGKNLGKANATTPEQQALAEAKSKWEKKLKGHNYNESLDAAAKGEASDVVEGGIMPMLAHKYSEHGEKIVFPAAVQPKFDGHRMTSQTLDENTTLWTRTRKQMFSMPHIARAIEAMGRRTGMGGKPLDGEGYHHDYRKNFEELTHYLRQPKYLPGSEVVQYHIYDIAMDGPFEYRNAYLRKMFEGEPADSPLKLVETVIVADEDELMLAFEKFLEQGYEGAIVRNLMGAYVNTRSYDLQKVKEFDDDDFCVIGVSEGRGKMAGRAVFTCETTKGITFEAKMKGPLAKLKPY
jgi:DNA ligase-1